MKLKWLPPRKRTSTPLIYGSPSIPPKRWIIRAGGPWVKGLERCRNSGAVLMAVAHQLVAVRQYDFREAHFISAIADSVSHDRDLIARMKRIFSPACICHAAGTRAAGGPFLYFSLVGRHVQIHPNMRIAKIESGHRALHGVQMFHVVTAPCMMGKARNSYDEQGRGQYKERQAFRSHVRHLLNANISSNWPRLHRVKPCALAHELSRMSSDDS